MFKAFRKPAEWILLGLLAYIPFHVLLSTWVGTSVGALTAAKILKDIILVVGFLMALLAVDRVRLKSLIKDKLVWVIAAYGLLTVGLALLRPTEQDAEVLGVVYNLRYLLAAVYAGLVVSWQKDMGFLKRALRVALAAGLIVALFGLVQYFILPDNALSHVGYSKSNGTPPAFFIDDKPDLERVMSTVKDPNSLGSYLVVIICLAVVISQKAIPKKKFRYLALASVALVCLWLTFSRGAVLALLLAIVCLVLIEPETRWVMARHRKKIAISLVTLLIIVTGGLYLARDTYVVKNVVFHADDQTVLEDPNQLRLRFWRESIDDISNNPTGSGPGTAGIVSIRNQSQGTVLNENYYLQIATETGIAGLILFVTILFIVAKRLYALRDLSSARGLLAGLMGLILTSLLIHTWSNETIAYTWWLLTGLLCFNMVSIYGKESKRLAKTKQ